MDSSNLMEFSMLEDEENQFRAPPLTQTPVVKNSILKPSTKDNLIQLATPIHKNLKVKFQTPQTVKVTPTRYEQIRELDDKENWVERTTVVLKTDHEDNVKNAQTVLLELIDQVIDSCEAKRNALNVSSEALSSESTANETLTETNEDTTTQDPPSTGENLPSETENNCPSSPPIISKTGAYTIDLENLDNINPFQTSAGLALSPPVKPAHDKDKGPGEPKVRSELEKEDVSKLDNIADITFSENKTIDGSETILFGDGDTTVIENKGGNSADITIIENAGKSELENTIVENSSQADVDVDFENITDPFSTKKQLNSPLAGPSGNLGKVENPFAALKSDLVDDNAKEQQDLLAEETADPFTSKSKVANSPLGKKCDERPTTQVPTGLDEENPFATKSSVVNSPKIDVDPFATKSNIANSPKVDVDPFATKSKVSNSPAVENNSATLNIDKNTSDTKPKDVNTACKAETVLEGNKSEVLKSPVKRDTENLITKSPSVSTEDNPFMSKSKVANSPGIDLEENPFSTKSNVVNSPAIGLEENPFSTKSTVVNSPAIGLEENPFSTKSKVVNSPTIDLEKNPFEMKSKVTNSPATNLEKNQFATKTNVANSPSVNPDANPFATKSKVPNSPAIIEENSFASKSKVANSPEKTELDDPFATKSKVANSPEKTELDDAFATKSKVSNSLEKTELDDPFATKSKVANSPEKTELDDPFATKSKVANSPEKTELDDPFTTKSKVANSPEKTELDDPFATKSKIGNSPSIDSVENPFITKSKVVQSPTKEELDPFTSRTNNPNSASGTSEENPFITKSRVADSPGSGDKKTMEDNVPGNEMGVTSRAPTATNNVEALGIDEDQFKPATDVFNDTAAWDALENFGSSSNDGPSALSRQSLYVKFDPLVNLPPDDPRRQSIDLRRASMKLERLRELNNAEESFLLLGTPPKVSSVRNVGIVAPSVIEGKKKTPAKTPVEALKRELAKDLLTDSPDLLSMSMDVSRLGKDSGEIKMNMADMILGSDAGIVEVLKYTEADLQKIQQAILMEAQGKLLAKDRETAQMKQQYEEKLNKYREEIVKRDEKARDSAKNFDEMMVILTEYEKTIDNVINEKEKLKEEKDAEIKKLKHKLEQLSNDEQSIETAYSDLHRRYDKIKSVLQGYVTNEETLKKYSDECSANVKATEEKMMTLKKDAEAKIKKAITEKDTLKSELEAETSKLKVTLKRKEMELQGVQNQLDQKIKENTELTSLCDELLAKVK